MSRIDVIRTREIARLRILVETQMERIKNFHIIQGEMQLSMASECLKFGRYV